MAEMWLRRVWLVARWRNGRSTHVIPPGMSSHQIAQTHYYPFSISSAIYLSIIAQDLDSLVAVLHLLLHLVIKPLNHPQAIESSSPRIAASWSRLSARTSARFIAPSDRPQAIESSRPRVVVDQLGINGSLRGGLGASPCLVRSFER